MMHTSQTLMTGFVLHIDLINMDVSLGAAAAGASGLSVSRSVGSSSAAAAGSGLGAVRSGPRRFVTLHVHLLLLCTKPST